MIKLMLVDDYPAYRQGLAELLRRGNSDFRLVGDTAGSGDLLRRISDLQPDVLLIDFHIQNMDAVETTRAVRETFPGVKVLMMSMSDREDDLFRAIDAGASAYVLKNVTLHELAGAIRRVAAGDPVIAAPMLGKLVEEFRRKMKATRTDMCALSSREVEVLNLAAQGRSNKEIAAQCFISETTVKAHIRSILSKMEVNNRAGAVAIATARGLVNKASLLGRPA